MPAALHALTIDVELLSLPSAGCEGAGRGGVVHSAFDSVVNVRPKQGLLWCVAARTVPPSPRTIITDADRGAFAHLAAGTPVRMTADCVTFGGGLRISLPGAVRWDSPPLPHAAVVPHRVVLFAGALARHGVAGGAVPVPASFSQAIARETARSLARIAEAVETQDGAILAQAVRRLIGLGIGLTPTGDDVLVGLAHAASRLGGGLAIIPPIIAAAVTPDATHLISATAIAQACRGRVPQPLADALAALCGEGTDGDIDGIVARLVTLGHSSGTDQATGLLAAARIAVQGHEVRC